MSTNTILEIHIFKNPLFLSNSVFLLSVNDTFNMLDTQIILVRGHYKFPKEDKITSK